jgi:hypothetical protein
MFVTPPARIRTCATNAYGSYRQVRHVNAYLLNRGERSCFAFTCRRASPVSSTNSAMLSVDSFCSLASSLLWAYLTPYQRRRLAFTKQVPPSPTYSERNRSSIGPPEFRTEDINTCTRSTTAENRLNRLHSAKESYGLPDQTTRSAFSMMFSQLNTEPVSSPVNA